jgi:hypothetical protein
MMPSPVTYWLQQIVISIVLLVTILLLPLAGARLVLAPLWPHAMDEIVIVSGDDRSGLPLFVPPGYQPSLEQIVLAQDRPHHLVTVESLHRPLVHGFPVGLREYEGSAMIAPLEAPGSILALPPDHEWLVLSLADGELLELPVAEIIRAYLPNRLTLFERAGIVWQRVVQGWRTRGGG